MPKTELKLKHKPKLKTKPKLKPKHLELNLKPNNLKPVSSSLTFCFVF